MDIHRYERFWISISVVAIVLMLAALLLAGLGMGFQLPGEGGTVDPRQLASQPPFDNPGVYEISPGHYQAIIVAKIWAFTPKEIRVPVNSKISFQVTSQDVTHGMLLQGTNINITIIPGQIAKFEHTFTTPGTYQYVCHEYCGVGHQAMFGQIIVEP